MTYLLFAITQSEIDETMIQDFEEEGVFISNYSEHIEEGMPGHFYYEISNGDSSKDDVNPYNRIEEMHDVIGAIHEMGKFKLVVVESQHKVEKLLSNEDGNLEKALSGLSQEKISLDEFLEKYPQDIDTNRMYIID